MKKFLHKAHQTLSATTYQIPTSTTGLPSTSPPSPQSPTPLSILRHRLHHGTNLGSIYVLEKWLFPHMFESSATGDSELDAVTAYDYSTH